MTDKAFQNKMRKYKFVPFSSLAKSIDDLKDLADKICILHERGEMNVTVFEKRMRTVLRKQQDLSRQRRKITFMI